MAAGEDKSGDFYAVLGLSKECTVAELRNAYKKLAMKWHPDRCSSSGSSKHVHVEEAKKKFQAIQQAYSVLSDANKRFLYDIGVYDSDDDDDENGMGEFLNEMVSMMSQNKQNDNGNMTFEDLQQLFEDTFHNNSDSSSLTHSDPHPAHGSSPQSSCFEAHTISNKRNLCDMSSSSYSSEASQLERFCMPLGQASKERIQGEPGGSRRDGRKQKISSGQDVSSGENSEFRNTGIAEICSGEEPESGEVGRFETMKKQ